MSAKILEGPKLRHFIEETTIGQYLFNRCEQFGNRICQIDGTDNKTETYASVKLRSIRLAIELQKRGVKPKDVITICSHNTLDNTIPIIAASFLGAIVTNLECSLSARHTQHLLSVVTPKIIFVEESAVALIEESLEDAKFEAEIVVFGTSEKYAVFSELVNIQENENEFKPTDVDPEDICLMLFSSGTTGLPKAICHSNTTILFLTKQLFQCGLGEAVLHFTSFYWGTGIGIFSTCFMNGSYRVFSRNPSAEDIFQMINKYKVAAMFLAPVLTYQLTDYKDSKNYDTNSLKVIWSGGTRIPPFQLQKMKDLFKSAFVSSAYGMSEIGTVALFEREFDEELSNRKLTSCGKPAAELKMKVVDLDTEEMVGPNQRGEIRIVSPGLMKGYYKLDSSQNFDNGGFLKTGDIGYYDDEGCVYLVDRIKEMFKYQSWHIVPSMLETVLLEHPAVREAVVFGIPCGKDDEVPSAVIVLEDGHEASEEDIKTFFEAKVIDREKLRGGIKFLKVLPRTPTGKIVRRHVRDFILSNDDKA